MVIVEIVAFGLIRSVNVEAGPEETFFRSSFAFAVIARSASAVGRFAVISYFCTCHVAERRVSACAKTTTLENNKRNANEIARVGFISAALRLGSDRFIY